MCIRDSNQVNRTTGEKILPGGKGINVSIVLQNLGIDNRAICFTSGFTGEALKALLMQRDMNADFIDIANGLTRINVKMRCGDETEVNGQGPEIKSEDIAELYEKLGYLDQDDYLVLAGSLPDCMSKTTYMAVSYTHLDVYKRQVWRCDGWYRHHRCYVREEAWVKSRLVRNGIQCNLIHHMWNCA